MKPFLIAGLAASALAMSAAGAPLQDRAMFKAETELVVLHVTVTDGRGGYVGGLQPEAFRVFEEGRAQAIRLFAAEDAPVTIGLVIDSSGSMRGVRDRVVDAVTAFMNACNPEDEVFAVVFNDDVQFALPPLAPFTNDVGTLRSRLLSVFTPAGRTALHDAIVDGLAQVAKGTRDRRVLTVLSDGGDNASHSSFKDTLARVQASNTVIYTLALVDPDQPDASPARLKDFADTSGGRAFSPHSTAEITRAFDDISRDVRHGYTLGYVPSGEAGHPGFQRIRVEVRDPGGHRLIARTRQGYLAGATQGGDGAR